MQLLHHIVRNFRGRKLSPIGGVRFHGKTSPLKISKLYQMSNVELQLHSSRPATKYKIFEDRGKSQAVMSYCHTITTLN